MTDYSAIQNPYGAHLERQESDNLTPETGMGVLPVSSSNGDGAGTLNPSGGGNVSEPSVKTSGDMSDVFIQNFIRSINWKPKKQGFTLNGDTGYAEFSNVFISGGVEATSGSIGGWNIAASELFSGNVKLQSADERILMGGATTYNTGIGIFLGKDGIDYKFRVGDPSGNKMTWDGSVLGITGNITGSTITGGIVQTKTSGERIVLTDNYESTGDPALAMYENAQVVGRIEPLLGVSGNGFRMYANDNSEVDQVQISVTTAGNNDGDSSIIFYPNRPGLDGVRLEWDYINNGTPTFGAATIDFVNCDLGSDLDPDGDETRDLGNASQKFDNIYTHTIYRTSESSPSDRRLKKDIKTMDFGLSQVLGLKPVEFKWKHNNAISWGFIAQDVREVLPQLVRVTKQREEIKIEKDEHGNYDLPSDLPINTKIKENKQFVMAVYKEPKKIEGFENEPGQLEIEISAFLPILTKAIQELSAKVDLLQNELNLLKNN